MERKTLGRKKVSKRPNLGSKLRGAAPLARLLRKDTTVIECALQAKKITKSFPGVTALKAVDFNLAIGEVHALVGENGAGKSTLMKIFGGVHVPDSGEIYLGGEQVFLKNPRVSQEKGICVIFQELNYFPDLSVEENLFFGVEPLNGLGKIRRTAIRVRSREILEELSLNIDSKTVMRDLSVAEKQLVEIGKALVHQSSLIIMDEPTSALSKTEIENLFGIIKRLKEKQVSIVLITHKIDEIFSFGLVDRVSVLRDGEHVGTYEISSANESMIIGKMVGRSIDNLFPKTPATRGKEILRVENLTKKDVFVDISFTLHEGEILGLAGLVGAKRTEVVSAIFGLFALDGGRIFIDGRETRIRSPGDALKAGIVMVPEERQVSGLFPELSLLENVCSATLGSVSRNGFLIREMQMSCASDVYGRLGIRGNGIWSLAKNFPGGISRRLFSESTCCIGIGY